MKRLKLKDTDSAKAYDYGCATQETSGTSDQTSS